MSIADINGAGAPATRQGRHGGRNVGERLDGFERELDALTEGIAALADAVDAQAAALVERLDTIGCTVNGTALSVALMAPAVTDSLGIVTDAQRIGWRKAWKARRRQAKAAK